MGLATEEGVCAIVDIKGVCVKGKMSRIFIILVRAVTDSSGKYYVGPHHVKNKKNQGIALCDPLICVSIL
jgi:hypothetical protein